MRNPLTGKRAKQKKPRIVLTGPPNSGKTTLFNWLTGFKRKTVNYPGSTALLSLGDILEKYNCPAELADTPGIYSLFSRSEDAKTALQALFENQSLSGLIVALDAGKLEIQLPFLLQLKSAGFPLVAALTMRDTLSERSRLNVSALEKELNCPVAPVNGLLGEGVVELAQKLKSIKIHPPLLRVKKIKDWDQEQFNKASDQAQAIVRRSLINPDQKDNKNSLFLSDKWDRLALSPRKGLLLFAGIMFGLFSSIFWLASPFMEAIDKAFSFLIRQSGKSLSAYPQLADLSHGLLASFGSVLVFAPQIFILFVGISLLENTGYLARAVALMDGPFSKIGLSGRSFVPFLSGYACAIPAILLARNLSSKKEKFMTVFAIPFMTCSARLPVYALLLSFLFYGQSAWKPGIALSFIYIASLFLGAGAVWILSLFLKGEEKEPFVLDLPLYRAPAIKTILQSALRQTRHYIVKAGPAIFFAGLAIWLLSHWPANPDLPPSERIQQSYAGQMGKLVEPVFGAMGLDWRAGTALIAAFAAREVFVSALVLIFSVTALTEEGLTHSLLETMKSASHPDGALIFTTASVAGLVIFFMFSLQCLSTTAIVYKESGSLKLALAQFAALNILAYFMSVLAYQSLSLI